MRAIARTILRPTGLLALGRWLRDTLRILRALPANARARQAADEDVAIPPTRLLLLVTGTPDVGWFLEGGRRAADSLRAVLKENSIPLGAGTRVLDFGCGCGRVLRHLRTAGVSLSGCDRNGSLVAWSREHLHGVAVARNPPAPPLDYEDRTFDLVYALSVFTHLPADLQCPWAGELLRVIRPGGHLVLSLHGRRYLSELSDAERRLFESGEVVVRGGNEPGSNRCGAYHPEAYVRERLARGFLVVEHRPEGALGNPHQDLWLLRRA